MNKTSMLLAMAVMATVLATGAFAGTSGPSPVPPPPNFQISTNSIILCKGMINNVPIAIKTPRGAATMESLQLSIVNSKSAYTVGNGTVSAVNVTANKTVVVPMHIFVSLNASSLISTGIGINYQYLTLYSDSEVRNISFGTETCPTSLSVNVTPEYLVSDMIQNVTFGLTNTGNTTLNYLSIHSALPQNDGTFLGAQPVQVRSISPRSTVYVSQRLFVYNNASQSFPINISISMYNGTSLEQLSVNPIVLSSGLINITSSSITLSPSVPTPGSIFSVSMVLTDIGTSKAAAVTAAALPTQGFEPYGSNSVFVGDIGVDTQTPVTITLSSQGSLKPGNYIIPVRISYLNSLRQNLSSIVYVPVQISRPLSSNGLVVTGPGGTEVRTSGRKGGSGIVALVLIIIVVVVSALYLMERKKHKLLKDEHRRLKDLRSRDK